MTRVRVPAVACSNPPRVVCYVSVCVNTSIYNIYVPISISMRYNTADTTLHNDTNPKMSRRDFIKLSVLFGITSSPIAVSCFGKGCLSDAIRFLVVNMVGEGYWPNYFSKEPITNVLSGKVRSMLDLRDVVFNIADEYKDLLSYMYHRTYIPPELVLSTLFSEMLVQSRATEMLDHIKLMLSVASKEGASIGFAQMKTEIAKRLAEKYCQNIEPNLDIHVSNKLYTIPGSIQLITYYYLDLFATRGIIVDITEPESMIQAYTYYLSGVPNQISEIRAGRVLGVLAPLKSQGISTDVVPFDKNIDTLFRHIDVRGRHGPDPFLLSKTYADFSEKFFSRMQTIVEDRLPYPTLMNNHRLHIRRKHEHPNPKRARIL